MATSTVDAIRKLRPAAGTTHHLVDYEAACAGFSWATARAALDGLPGGALNIAHEAVDRHASGPHRAHPAIRWLASDGHVRDITYGDLCEQTNRFANLLAALGVTAGERVFAACGRIPELYIAALGTLKYGGVFCPLFSAFGPEPIRQRLQKGNARVLVTTSGLYATKVAQIRDDLPNLEHILVIGEPAGIPGGRDLTVALALASPQASARATRPETPALLHFTSGTTGTPKGAVHVHEAVVAHHATAQFALDLHREDVFWCTADPGWVTGTSYGIIAPLTIGATLIVEEGEFDAERWYQVLERERVTVWYTAPTAIRRLMRLGDELPAEHDLSALRFIASVGEPLNAEAVVWGSEVLGRPIHDNWWQTETGAIMIANFAACDVKPGSMGRPLPGVEAAVVRRVGNGVEVVDAPGTQGELALRAGWPSMFRAYLDEDERYQRSFVDGWYLSGDLVTRDEDGYYWFVGRGDDVIKSAGHLIGPFEVERVLTEHPAVAEAGVIGVPDPVAGETVKAFVSLHQGHVADDALRRDILAHARRRLGASIAPRAIAFRDQLPHTRSGKIMRRLLKAEELGLPAGDLSTLEHD